MDAPASSSGKQGHNLGTIIKAIRVEMNLTCVLWSKTLCEYLKIFGQGNKRAQKPQLCHSQ